MVLKITGSCGTLLTCCFCDPDCSLTFWNFRSRHFVFFSLSLIVEIFNLIASADRFKQLVSPLCSFTMTDNNVLISKILRAVVDSICPIEPMASAPALAQTPASSMNVAVNNFIPDCSGWRKPNADQGWSSWSHPAWEADGRDEWSWSGHAGHAKQLKDKWSNEKGKAKNWKADPEEWKPPQVADASPLPVEKAPVDASQVASFIIPSRNYFVGRCRFGGKCKCLHTQLTSVSDEFFDYFVKKQYSVRYY